MTLKGKSVPFDRVGVVDDLDVAHAQLSLVADWIRNLDRDNRVSEPVRFGASVTLDAVLDKLMVARDRIEGLA